ARGDRARAALPARRAGPGGQAHDGDRARAREGSAAVEQSAGRFGGVPSVYVVGDASEPLGSTIPSRGRAATRDNWISARWVNAAPRSVDGGGTDAFAVAAVEVSNWVPDFAGVVVFYLHGDVKRPRRGIAT